MFHSIVLVDWILGIRKPDNPIACNPYHTVTIRESHKTNAIWLLWWVFTITSWYYSTNTRLMVCKYLISQRFHPTDWPPGCSNALPADFCQVAGSLNNVTFIQHHHPSLVTSRPVSATTACIGHHIRHVDHAGFLGRIFSLEGVSTPSFKENS